MQLGKFIFSPQTHQSLILGFSNFSLQVFAVIAVASYHDNVRNSLPASVKINQQTMAPNMLIRAECVLTIGVLYF